MLSFPKRRALRWRAFFLAAASAVLLAACLPEKKQDIPDPLRIGVLPDQAPEQLIARYTPLADYLGEQLGVEVVLKVPDSYQHLLDQFHEGEIDLAYFGGVTFVEAHLRDGAQPLALRDVDANFTSYFIVRANHPARDIRDLNGARLSFGSRLSTSGHFMPRHFLKAAGIEPESFFADVQYSGAHDRTVIAVRDDLAEVGAANAVVVDTMFADGRLRRDDIRVLWETPPYADYVWAMRSQFAEAEVDRMRDLFLALSRRDPHHAQILQALGAHIFLPASMSDFMQLETLVAETKQQAAN